LVCYRCGEEEKNYRVLGSRRGRGRGDWELKTRKREMGSRREGNMEWEKGNGQCEKGEWGMKNGRKRNEKGEWEKGELRM
jgi:hypothetical protein